MRRIKSTLWDKSKEILIKYQVAISVPASFLVAWCTSEATLKNTFLNKGRLTPVLQTYWENTEVKLLTPEDAEKFQYANFLVNNSHVSIDSITVAMRADDVKCHESPPDRLDSGQKDDSVAFLNQGTVVKKYDLEFLAPFDTVFLLEHSRQFIELLSKIGKGCSYFLTAKLSVMYLPKAADQTKPTFQPGHGVFLSREFFESTNHVTVSLLWDPNRVPPSQIKRNLASEEAILMFTSDDISTAEKVKLSKEAYVKRANRTYEDLKDAWKRLF